jgi:PAS domain S-box-containing protein
MTASSGLWPEAKLTVEFVATIIDHLGFPVFVKDRDFRFVLVNRALCDMLGYAHEQMLGRTDYDFFPRAEADFFRAKDLEMFASEAPVIIDEESITDSAGKRHVLSTTKVPMRDAHGTVTHLAGIIHDISKLKDMEDELRRTQEQLELRVEERTAALRSAQQELVRKERLAVLGRLSGGLAHEIRNPLGAISNAAYVLDKLLRDHPNDDVAKAVEIVREEAWRANRIVTDLVDYARVRPPSPVPTSAAQLFGAVLGEQRIPERIRLVRDDADVPLSVDVSQTRSVLGNLVRNAVEAMPDGGTLTLSARCDGEQALLSVTDTGGGIAAAVAGHLFEPLFTTKPAGLGLGLATAKALAENQGGSITFQPVSGGGTRVEVRLPCRVDSSLAAV